MFRIFLCLLLAFGCWVSAVAQTPSGTALLEGLRARQIGPAVMSGRISSLAVVPDHPEIIYIGTAGGGVWKSISGGTTVRPVFDDHTLSIGKIAVAPSQPQTVWVGTGEPWTRNSVSIGDGAYRSTDGGNSWQHMGLVATERIADIIIHPDDPNVVYIAALGHLWNANEERGVYKTTDGGASWQKILYVDQHTGAADLSVDPTNPDVLYATMWSHRRRPWDFNSGFNDKSGLYKTEDGGAHWQRLEADLPQEPLGRLAVEVAPSNPDVVYLTVECKSKDKKGLYRSENAGRSWQLINNEFNVTVRPFYFANLTVDPTNDSIVMKCGLQAIISEDRGQRFRPIDQTVHSDIHDIWINPVNNKHLLLATDGGVYESFDRGYTFRMWMNLPVSQFYHVSVDDAVPFNVYGGLQDNGSWYGPSRKAGGITNSDWKNSYGGDGFYSFRHPADPDIIYSEFQGGELVRFNQATGQSQSIKPYAAAGEDQLRFNWNAPIHLSRHQPDRLYFGAQYLFRSEDRGNAWTRISPDLTSNDSAKQQQSQSGGLTIDNSTAENHCTIYAIAESPLNERVVWAGTDDGNLHVTTDGGENWQNVVQNIPGLPANTWVSFIEASPHDPLTAFVTFDGHRTGDKQPYLFRTRDGGKTWSNLITASVEGYALSVRQDLVQPGLLFLGTEFGLFVSLNDGADWDRFENNVPRVGVRDMVIHPRDHALVLATHGRGIIIIDDISLLRQLDQEILSQSVAFLEMPPTILRDPGAGGGWFGGSADFVGPNPSDNARIAYYLNRRHNFGKMYLEVWRNGALLRTLPAGKRAGINIVEMPMAIEKPKAPPTTNRMALFGAMTGPNLEAGTYEVKLVKGKDTFETSFSLINDPQAPYSTADRQLQHNTTMELYHLTEQLAYQYHVLDLVGTSLKAVNLKNKKAQAKRTGLLDKTEKLRSRLVSLDGDFYVDEGQEVYERVSNLYRLVSSYPGRPSEGQMTETEQLNGEMEAIETTFAGITGPELKEVNEALDKAGLGLIVLPDKAAFLAGDDTSAGESGGRRSDRYFRTLTGSPLGWHWAIGLLR